MTANLLRFPSTPLSLPLDGTELGERYLPDAATKKDIADLTSTLLSGFDSIRAQLQPRDPELLTSRHGEPSHREVELFRREIVRLLEQPLSTVAPVALKPCVQFWRDAVRALGTRLSWEILGQLFFGGPTGLTQLYEEAGTPAQFLPAVVSLHDAGFVAARGLDLILTERGERALRALELID